MVDEQFEICMSSRRVSKLLAGCLPRFSYTCGNADTHILILRGAPLQTPVRGKTPACDMHRWQWNVPHVSQVLL